MHYRICPLGCSANINSNHAIVASESCRSIQKALLGAVFPTARSRWDIGNEVWILIRKSFRIG